MCLGGFCQLWLRGFVCVYRGFRKKLTLFCVIGCGCGPTYMGGREGGEVASISFLHLACVGLTLSLLLYCM